MTYYTTSQVADMLSLKEATVRQYFREGKITGFKLPGERGGIRFSERDIQRFEKNCREL